jgi:hypothetical protein
MYSQSFLNTPANLSFQKARSGQSNVIILEDAFASFGTHAHGMSAYIAMMPAIRKAQQVMGTPTVKVPMERIYGPDMKRKLDDRIAAWTLVSQPGEGAGDIERGLAGLMHNVVRAKLSANPSPVLKQPAGLLTLATELSDSPSDAWRLMMRYGIPSMMRQEWHDRLRQYAPLLRERAENVASRLVSPESGRPKPLLGMELTRDKLMRGLTWADENNSVAAFAAFSGKVREQNPGWTDEQVYAEAGRLAERAVGRTQNSSNVMDYTGVSLEGKKSMMIRLATTFRSQSMANYNTIWRAKRRYDQSQKTAADRGKFAHDIAMASVLQSLWTAAVTTGLGWATWALVRAMLNEPDEQDEKREPLVEKFAFSALQDMTDIGGPGVGELANVLRKTFRIVSGREYYRSNEAQREDLLSQTFIEIGEAIKRIAGAKDAGDVVQGLVQAAKFTANLTGAPEYPLNVASKVSKVYGESQDKDLQKSKILTSAMSTLYPYSTRADVKRAFDEAFRQAQAAGLVKQWDAQYRAIPREQQRQAFRQAFRARLQKQRPYLAGKMPE